MVERNLDHLAGRRPAERLEGAGEIDPVETHDDVGVLEERRQFVLGEHHRRIDMERMVGGEGRPDLEVGANARANCFGQGDAMFPRGLVARHPAGEDDRALGRLEPFRGLPDGIGGRGVHDRRHVPVDVAGRQRLLEHRLLHVGIEIDVDRALRRGVGEPRAAQQRFTRGGRGGGLVVPLGVGAHDRALVGGGVDPVDPRPALCRVDRAGGAEDDDRHAVAPGVEDRHGGVEQPDIGMYRGAHRLAGDLGIAVGDRDRRLFVQAQQHLRRGVADVIDQAVVQAAIARPGIERDIGNVEIAQHLGHDIAAEAGRIGAGRDRTLDGGGVDLVRLGRPNGCGFAC